MSGALLKIGTRGSQLALAQADEVARRLRDAHPDLAAPDAIEIVVIKTTGDKVLDRPLADIGGKGLFTKEIEEALIDRSIDVAVHSMKDVPTWLPDGLAIRAILPREDPRDVLLSPSARTLADLPEGAVVGTASLRRQSQLLAARPDLKVVPFRGNVNTRLRKLDDGEVDATILALAGLRRLGMAQYEDRALDVETMLPAVAQGAVGVECRADDTAVTDRLAALNDAATASCVAAERAMLEVLDGSCRTPIAGLGRLDGGALSLTGLVAATDGREVHRTRQDGAGGDAETIGRTAGEDLLSRAGRAFLAASD